MMKKCYTPATGMFVLRFVLGIIFIMHGYAKIQMMDGAVQFFATLGFGAFWAHLVAYIEFLGGIALILGIFTQIVTILLAISMLIVILKVKGLVGILGGSGIELELALFGGLIAVLLGGPGVWALGPKVCGCCKGGTCKGDGCVCHNMCGSNTCGSDKMKCDNCDTCKGGCSMHEKQ